MILLVKGIPFGIRWRLSDGAPTANDLHTRDRLDLSLLLTGRNDEMPGSKIRSSVISEQLLTCLSWRISEGSIMYCSLIYSSIVSPCL